MANNKMVPLLMMNEQIVPDFEIRQDICQLRKLLINYIKRWEQAITVDSSDGANQQSSITDQQRVADDSGSSGGNEELDVDDDEVLRAALLNTAIESPMPEVDYKKLLKVNLSLGSVEDKYQNLKMAMHREEVHWREKIDRLKRHKAQFVDYLESTFNSKADAQRQYNVAAGVTAKMAIELDQCVKVEGNLHMKVYSLGKKQVIPEACRRFLIRMSPPEWQKAANVVRAASEDVSSTFHDRKTVDIAQDPGTAMYWTNVDDFIEKMEVLELQTLHAESHVTWMKQLVAEDDLPPENDRSAIERVDQMKDEFEFIRAKFRQGEIAEDKPEEKNSWEPLRDVFMSESMINVESMSDTIYKTLKYKNSLAGPFNMIVALFTALDRVDEQLEDLPPELLAKAKQTVAICEKNDALRHRAMKLEYDAIHNTEKRSKQLFALPSDVGRRVQKILPHRSTIPKPLKPAKPPEKHLNEKQLLYLECFTWIPPETVVDIDSVPELDLQATEDLFLQSGRSSLSTMLSRLF